MSIAGILGAVGSVAGEALSAVGASGQASAAKDAAQLQYEAEQQALAQNQQQFQTTQAEQAPFLQAGQGAVTQLSSLLNSPGEGLLTPWTQQFQAPTAAQAEAYPGYQFQLQQGLTALNNSAAAQGNLLSSGTQKALANYAEQAGQTDYANVYNQALGQYQQAYNIFQNNQANTYNRLAGLSGTGQTAANTLGQLGQQNAQNTSNILFTGAQGQGQQLNNAAAATASGYTALGNTAAGVGSQLGQTALLAQLLKGTSLSSGLPNGGNNPYVDNSVNFPNGVQY